MPRLKPANSHSAGMTAGHTAALAASAPFTASMMWRMAQGSRMLHSDCPVSNTRQASTPGK